MASRLPGSRRKAPGTSPQKPAEADSDDAIRSPESARYRQMLAVLTQFRIVVANLKRHYHDIEKITGVSGTQLWALIAIHHQPGVTVGELARELAVHQSTASNLLDRLAELGHITRLREDADQRVVSIHLTAKGRQTVKSAPKPAMGLLQNALLSLPEARVAGLHDHLDELIRSIGVRRKTDEATPLSVLLDDAERTRQKSPTRK